MAEIILKTDNPDRVTDLIKRAIAAEIDRIEKNLKFTKKRLQAFEDKYNQPSHQLKNRLTAEDMDGGDLEYLEWAGEYKLFLELEEQIKVLKSLEYVNP
ncbi:hypothetical protein [Laspinema palackyanum]|uniref:Uncharacterized protein n=1 Tax=Laspinema palackyanum D2a TaxID=2953684 RepID=A0ABT2MWE7_9CYAN|nr:hypothetical protein [Laspinema sp. D2c]MCT7962038.1 hypothetical protein [Laspinema sp. D2b]MCT7969071.1 hypothetical protein [Laspinema sp. D2a]